MVEERLQFLGLTAYPGVIYGRCKKLKSQEILHIPQNIEIHPEERKKEVQRFLNCIQQTEQEMDGIIQECVTETGSVEVVEILTSQKDMLNDPLFKDGVISRIQELGEGASLALVNTVQRIYDDFLDLDDEFFSERADHIQDIGKRVNQNLLHPNAKKTSNHLILEHPCILVAKDISPSELLEIDKSKILGIATDHGGKTGHMAIIARNYGIPTIVGLKNLSYSIQEDEYILLDAERGFVKRDPDLEEFKFFGPRCIIPIQNQETFYEDLKTQDGARIFLKANLETDEECEDILNKRAEGIGLYRSEVLYLQFKNHTPTEEEQFHTYKKILKSMGDLPVVIRAFDIGADKYEVGAHEDNPFLGNRGIRYLLRHEKFFKEQLRALLRASNYGSLQILIPMITTIREILDTKQLLEEAKRELIDEGIPFAKKIPLGIMVETPACAFGLEEFIKHVEFISVGTNDLLQYTMAVERNNYSISDLYNPFHFVFLDLLESIVNIANKKRIPVSICGEVATDTNMTGLLLAMGYRDLSIAPPFLPLIQDRIRSMKLKHEKKVYKRIKNLAREDKFYEIEMLIKGSNQ